MARRSKGRQKVEMVKMSNESNLQVTFSKRRSGLFKKASELCTLCGAEVAIVVFSPGNKVFSFGHPCVESVIDRFITRTPPQTSGALQLIEAHRNANVRDLNMELTQVLEALEVEKRRGEELTQIKKTTQGQYWWQKPIDELDPTQVAQLKVALLDLKKKVTEEAEKFMIQSSAPPQCFPESSSAGGIDPFDPNNTGFNPLNMNMIMPPPPPPHHHHQHQPHQPLSFPPNQPHQPLPYPPPNQPNQHLQPHQPLPFPPPHQPHQHHEPLQPSFSFPPPPHHPRPPHPGFNTGFGHGFY